MKEPRERLLDILRSKGFTSFEVSVYKLICSISWGETKSYKWVADKLNKPQSQRAVGQALKKNPFPFIIPCHRIIRQDGKIGGFSCGTPLKKRLLEAEKVDIIMHTRD